MKFESLVSLFQETHQELKKRAARSVDISLVVRNWLFGWFIVEYEQRGEDRAEYGKRLLKNLSRTLTKLAGKGFSERSLELYRKFYSSYRGISQTLSAKFEPGGREELYIDSKGPIALKNRRIVSAELRRYYSLGWSHYVVLMTVDNPDERSFYEVESIQNSWSVRELKRQVASSLYERLALSRDKTKVRELSEKGLLIEKPEDVVKNPYVLEFLNLKEQNVYTENSLEIAIIDKLENFLLELGKGFLFEARQKRFTFDEDHFYVDLVFYNRLLRCYVLIDLKRDKLTHQDLGQMQMYVNYFDRFVKIEGESPTIGIVLCHRKNDALVELTLPEESNIFASKYQLYLPSKDELRKQVEDALRCKNVDE